MKFRSLAATNPELVEQWHPVKNGQLRPDKVAAGSKRVVWWRCENGHEWQIPIASRHRGSKCPRCTLSTTSLPEQYLFNALRPVFPDAVNAAYIRSRGKNVELDIYIPEIKLAVEYDGIHHAAKWMKDEEKNMLLQKRGIQLIRVRCGGLPDIENHGSLVIKHDPEDPSSIRRCLQFIGDYILTHTACTESQRIHLEMWTSTRAECTPELSHPAQPIQIAVSIAVLHPRVARAWHPLKNHPLTPYDVSVHSRRRVWWQCQNGHAWQATVRHRAKGVPCPYCSGKYAPPDGSVTIQRPELAQEWHANKHEAIQFSNLPKTLEVP